MSFKRSIIRSNVNLKSLTQVAYYYYIDVCKSSTVSLRKILHILILSLNLCKKFCLIFITIVYYNINETSL